MKDEKVDLGLCRGCGFTKFGIGLPLPCQHPITREQVIGSVNLGNYARAKAYATIRERLGLKFKPKSWDVTACQGLFKKDVRQSSQS